jgi:hypothetical protein
MAAISAFHSQSFLQTLSIKLNVSIRKKGFPFNSGCGVSLQSGFSHYNLVSASNF